LHFNWDASIWLVAEDKEKTIQKSVRLPVGDMETIELLAQNSMLGSNRSAVMRALISGALRQLAESEYVKKQKEALKLLKGE
jgi:hypothetical protein